MYEDIEAGSETRSTTHTYYEDSDEYVEDDDYTRAELEQTPLESGLTTHEVWERRQYYGRNTVPSPNSTRTGLVLFLQQFTGSFLPILCEIFAIVLICFGKWNDFLVLFTMLLINACLGFYEERKSKLCVEELASSYENEIPVIRDGGAIKIISVKDLVPGDVCLLVGGTVLPADIMYKRGDPTIRVDT